MIRPFQGFHPWLLTVAPPGLERSTASGVAATSSSVQSGPGGAVSTIAKGVSPWERRRLSFNPIRPRRGRQYIARGVSPWERRRLSFNPIRPRRGRQYIARGVSPWEGKKDRGSHSISFALKGRQKTCMEKHHCRPLGAQWKGAGHGSFHVPGVSPLALDGPPLRGCEKQDLTSRDPPIPGVSPLALDGPPLRGCEKQDLTSRDPPIPGVSPLAIHGRPSGARTVDRIRRSRHKQFCPIRPRRGRQYIARGVSPWERRRLSFNPIRPRRGRQYIARGVSPWERRRLSFNPIRPRRGRQYIARGVSPWEGKERKIAVLIQYHSP